jgi:hypothetical protein
LALGEAVRGLAETAGIPALAADGLVPLDDLLDEDLVDQAAHLFGMVLAGELGFDAYYTMPFDGGRATALIRDDRLHFTEDYPLNRMVSVFSQVISATPVLDHRAAFIGYANAYRLKVAPEPDRVVVTTDAGGDLTATFDARGRLAQLQGTVVPKKKPKE